MLWLLVVKETKICLGKICFSSRFRSKTMHIVLSIRKVFLIKINHLFSENTFNLKLHFINRFDLSFNFKNSH